MPLCKCGMTHSVAHIVRGVKKRKKKKKPSIPKLTRPTTERTTIVNNEMNTCNKDAKGSHEASSLQGFSYTCLIF